MSNKFFSVKHRASGKTAIAKAPSPALAIVAITSSASDARPYAGVKPATDEQVFDHTAVKHKTLHPKSREREDGLRLFVVPVSADADSGFDLVRAKNSEEAFSLVTDDEYEVSQLSQEDLLNLVGENAEVVEYTPPAKRKRAKKTAAAPKSSPEAGATNGAANASTEAAGAGAGPTAEGSPQHDATPDPAQNDDAHNLRGQAALV